MKNECNVARDLMPLCIDGVASEESQKYVDEHIAECAECAVAYDEMKVALPRANVEKERSEMEKTAKKLRCKRILRGIAGAMAGIAIFMALYLGVPKLLTWYEKKQFVDKYVCENGDLKLAALYYDVSRSPQSRNALVQVDIYSFPSGNAEFDFQFESVAVNDGTGICVQYRAVYAPNDEDASWGGSACSGQMKDGKWVTVARDIHNEHGPLIELPIVRLELHAGDEFVVLWEEGDVLQTPEEAKIKREAEQAKYTTK